MAVRFSAFELRTWPPALKVCRRLSPVPVLPPITSGAPSGRLKVPCRRRAVPASTTWDSALRRVVATSEVITRWPRVASGAKRVS